MDRGTHCRGGVLPRRLPGVEGGEPPWTMEETGPTDIWPLRSKTPRRGRGHPQRKGPCQGARSSLEALATMATLEEEIEQLSWSITRGQ